MADENKQEGQAGTEGAAGAAGAAGGAEAKNTLITIKVDGKEQKYSQEEIVRMAEKSAGADARFMAASELKKEATKGLRIEHLYDTISGAADVSKVDAEARELAGLLNLNPDEFINSLKDEQPAGGKQPAEAGKGKKLSIEDLDDDARAALTFARSQMYNQQVQVVKDSINQTIDTEAHCVKMIQDLAGDDEKLAKELKSELLDQTFNDVQRRVLSQEQTELNSMVSSSLQEVRGRLERQVKKFGTPLMSSGGVPVIPLGQAGSIPTAAYAKEPVKRIPSTDANYAGNFATRLLQRAIKAGQRR